MKISGIVASLLFAVAMMVSTDAFAGASGKVDSVANGGRQVTIAGKEVSISGSRTSVKINGKDDDRGNIKPGMTCTADVDSGEAGMVDCK